MDASFFAEVLTELLSLSGIPRAACLLLGEMEDRDEKRELVEYAASGAPPPQDASEDRKEWARTVGTELRERAGLNLNEHTQRRVANGGPEVTEEWLSLLTEVLEETGEFPGSPESGESSRDRSPPGGRPETPQSPG
jgi:hypothetical protein